MDYELKEAIDKLTREISDFNSIFSSGSRNMSDTADDLRQAVVKINANMEDLYSVLGKTGFLIDAIETNNENTTKIREAQVNERIAGLDTSIAKVEFQSKRELAQIRLAYYKGEISKEIAEQMIREVNLDYSDVVIAHLQDKNLDREKCNEKMFQYQLQQAGFARDGKLFKLEPDEDNKAKNDEPQ